MRPLAYHITWGTYGTRLHGDPRRTVVRGDNVYGSPVLGLNRRVWAEMKGNLRFAPRKLTREQMVYVERVVPEVCARGGWEHRESAAGPDHVHVLLTCGHEPMAIRRMLKRWVGETLCERWELSEGETWWAEGGSIRWVGDEGYLQKVTGYVRGQRATGR